jgi:hypothetical protein
VNRLLVVGVIGLFLGLVCAPSINANISKDDELVNNSKEIYFVIGIGFYMVGGTWPVIDEICPIFLIRFGKYISLGRRILGPKSGERIDFIEGDRFIGYYPFLNPIGIGFVCGIWIDI